MKRFPAALCALAFLALTACRSARTDPPAPPETEEPLYFESLTVEVSRSGLAVQELARTVRELPEALKAALAENGVEVEEVTVTAGASPESTAEAISLGTVDAAFFSAEEFAALEVPPVPLLTAGPPSTILGDGIVSDEPRPGACALICAAPTEYGVNLSERNNLTWEEVSQARWGLLEEGHLLGRGAVDLWLTMNYDKTTADLERVTVCDSYETLLQTAAAGEIDLLPLWEGPRQEWAEAWTMDTSKTDYRGVRGLGRPGSLEEELPILAVTDRLYTAAAGIRGDGGKLGLTEFAQALAASVNALAEEFPVFGPYPYGPAEDLFALSPQRMLAGLGD